MGDTREGVIEWEFLFVVCSWCDRSSFLGVTFFTCVERFYEYSCSVLGGTECLSAVICQYMRNQETSAKYSRVSYCYIHCD